MSNTATRKDFFADARSKITIPDAWEMLGLDGEPKPSCKSPFREDRSPSFSIHSEGKAFKDHATGDGGDVIEFIRLAIGGDHRDVREWLGSKHAIDAPTYAPRTEPKPAQEIIPELPPEFEAAHRAARFALFDACARRTPRAHEVSKELGVSIETLQELTFSSDALGIEDGYIMYLYETGAKRRSRPGATGARFVWTCGRAVLPWRWHLAARPEVRQVIVCEGESDCCAAIEAGLENLYPKDGTPACVVVAIPGTSFLKEWGGLFRGKQVILLFDRDEAGQAATQKVAKIVAPFAASVKIAKWEGVNSL
jgi:hypothetical protein